MPVSHLSRNLCTVNGVGHTWPGGTPLQGVGRTSTSASASEDIWTFFESHPRRQCLSPFAADKAKLVRRATARKSLYVLRSLMLSDSSHSTAVALTGTVTHFQNLEDGSMI